LIPGDDYDNSFGILVEGAGGEDEQGRFSKMEFIGKKKFYGK
jgi:hypothetical protein